MNAKKGKFGFMAMLLMVGCIPLTVAILILAIYSATSMKSELEENVYQRLTACATSVSQYFLYDIEEDCLDPLDELSLNFIDSLEPQEIELTLFKEDTRLTTSIKDAANETGRNVGTTCNADIWNTVKTGKAYTADKVVIDGDEYYVAYVPLKLPDGTVWGMGFAGEKEVIVSKAINSIIKNTIIISVIVFALFLAIILFVAKLVVRPLVAITDATETLSKGDLSQDIEAKSILTETNILLVAAQNLQKTLREAVGSVKQNAVSLTDAVAEVDSKTENNTESVSQISMAINEVAETSNSVALSAQTLASKADELGVSIEELVETVKLLNDASNSIKKANIEASEYMNTVMDSSEKSTLAVENIVEEIDETNKAISSITSAVAMIEEIASETKLLSLNASIEAARAGEAGRGFSVVASNIKSLAEQSSGNVEQIRSIISRVTELSQKSVRGAENVKNIIEDERKYISDTQAKFNVLSQNVDDSLNRINSISSMTDALTDIKVEVTNATSDLGAISEELSASSQEVSASTTQVSEALTLTRANTEEMSALNENLVNAVSFFKD